MDKSNSISEEKYKSKLFRSVSAWMKKHGTVLTAIALVAISAVLGCAEANIIYGAASTDYGTNGSTSSPSYVGGSGNNPTVYEPGVIGVSLATYDLDKVGSDGLKYGAVSKTAAPVASTSDLNDIKKGKNNYTGAPADQKDYYPYWIRTGYTEKGEEIYKYSNSLHHAITANILAMQTAKSYDDSTLVYVPRVIASKDHHAWIKNLTQSVVVNGSKANKKAVFYDQLPWYDEKDAGNLEKASEKVTSGIVLTSPAGTGKNTRTPGVFYGNLKGYLKDKQKKETKKQFLEIKSADGSKTYEVCNYSKFSGLEKSKSDVDKIIGYRNGKITEEGRFYLQKAQKLFASFATISEPSKGQYTTTPEILDVYMRYTTAAGLGKDTYGTGMFSAYGKAEGLYGKEKDNLSKVNKNMIGAQVIRSLYQSNKRFNSTTADGAKKIDDIQKTVINDEYNTHYLDLLLCGNSIAKASGDKKAAAAWLEGVQKYAASAADTSATQPNVVLRLDMGMAYATSSEVTYASCGSVINKHYGFSKAGAFESSKTTNSKSFTKGFIGFSAGDDSSKQNYQAHNQEVATKKGVVTKSSYKNAGYGTYYNRLSHAIKNTKVVTGNGQGWYSRMVIMRTTAAYYSMSSKNGPVNSRVYNKLAAVELLRTVASNYGVNPRKGDTSSLAWQYGTYATDGYSWKSVQPDDDSDISFNLAIFSKNKNKKAPAQDGKDIKETYQLYCKTGTSPTETIKDDLYVKLSPTKDEESQKLFNKILSDGKYYVKIVFENADGTTATSLLDPTVTNKVKKATDPVTGTKYAAKKETTYYKVLNKYDSVNKSAEKGDQQNYNKLVSAKQVGGKDLQTNKSLIWRISNADVRNKGFKISGTGSYYVNWKAKVYIVRKSGSGSDTTWTSAINGKKVKKTKPSASDLEAGGCATTNNVIAQYVYHKEQPDPPEVNKSATYESIPEAYAELKEGSVYNETFEAMAGVPSTRSLYFATGGSEFIVNMQAVYDDYYLKDETNATKDTYRSTRKYKTRFNGVDCEYKKGDTLKTLSAGETKTETFVADVNDKKQEKTVTAEKNNAVNPTGASSYNTTIKEHTTATKFEATWTGTIANNTPEPEDEGKYTAGKPGSPCPGSGFTPGTQRTKKDAKTKWDVSSYNDAVKNAFQWAKDMEKTNENGTVIRIDDSDGYKRIYKIGNAEINITLTGGSKNYETECGNSKNLSAKAHDYDSSGAADAKLESDDSSVLGSGYSYTKGEVAKGTVINEGHGHGKSCPGHGTDRDGNEIPCPLGEHSCKFTDSYDITYGPSDSISYKITVTFKEGKITARNYDGKAGLTVNTKTGLTKIEAHALCGPCCEHVLPTIEDTWTQKLRFDTIRFTNLKVWKLQEGYAEGMGEIRKTDEGSGTSIEGDAGKKEADEIKAEKEKNKDNPTVINPDQSDQDGTEASNDKQYDENGDVVIPDYDTGELGDDPDAEGDGNWSDDDSSELDVVKSQIVRYDPNIFYNIAQQDTSKAGRIRYSLQTGQDDDVTWIEFNDENKLTRTDFCDGTTKSHSTSPVKVEATGHKKSWCKGCLYSNSTYGNLRNQHDNAKTSGAHKGEPGEAAETKEGYTYKEADAIDKASFEWKRFDYRRHLNCKATVISDFLILQTSSGNESIVYYQDTVGTKHNECQENYEDTLWYSKPTDMNNFKAENVDKANWMWENKMWTQNPYVKKSSALNVGGYNGNYSSTSTKYQGNGGNATVETAFDKDEEYYNHIADTDENGTDLGLAKVTSARVIETKQKQMSDAESIMRAHSNAIDGNICSPGCGNTYNNVNYDTYGSGSARMDKNTADVYVAPTKQSVWGKYGWIDRINPSLNGQTSVPEPAQFGNAGLVLLQDGIAQCPTNPNQEYVTGQSYAFFIPLVTYTNFGADKSAEKHDLTDYTFKYSDENNKVVGKVGYTMDSIYTNGQTKVNNIVVHDPVSVQGANLITVNPDMDQRVLGDDKSGAAEMNKEANEDLTCPGTAQECQYRLLNCQFGKPSRKAAFSIDNAKHNETTDEDGVVHAYDSIISNILSAGGTYMDVSLADSGFSLKRYDGKGAFEGVSEDDENQPDRYLAGEGKASLAMSWSSMGADVDTGKTDTYELQGVFLFHGALNTEKALFTTRATKLLAEPNGKLKIVLADGSEYTSTTSPLAPDGRNTIQYRFGLDSVVMSAQTIAYKDGTYTVDANTGATVNGTKISFTKTKGATDDMTNYTGEGIWIGNQDDVTGDGTAYDRAYDCNYYVDNLAVTRLAPEKDANGVSYKHTLSCFAGVTKHDQATQNYYNGVSEKSVKAEKVTKTFKYTGEMQSITLPAGTYTLTALGAQGGSSSTGNGGLGGYSEGTVTLDKETTLYIGVGGQGKTFNGGGQGKETGQAGGGATHIATADGELSTLSGKKDSILLVAGGGGGAQRYSGGNGGGANQSGSKPARGDGIIGTAGTLDSGFGFGQGGFSTSGLSSSANPYYGGAGGGGYYGGNASVPMSTNGSTCAGGSGGSGYAAESLTGVSGITGSNAGDGLVKITYYNYVPVIDWTGAHDNGLQTQTGENNRHEHSDGCLTISEGLKIAAREAQAGDYTSIKKMLGSDLWAAVKTELDKNGTVVASASNFGNMYIHAGNTTISSRLDGYLHFTTGTDGFFWINGESVLKSQSKYGSYDKIQVMFNHANSSNTKSQLFYDANEGFNNDHFVWASIDGKGATFNISNASGFTKENAKWLRFDLPGNNYSDTINVTEIRLLKTDYSAERILKIVKKIIGTDYSKIPEYITTGGRTIVTPFWGCQCIYNKHVCTSKCTTSYELQCKEPHHKVVNGKVSHYDAGNEICYDACGNDELHKLGSEQANAGKDGSTSKPLTFGDFILLDNYFYLYYPNNGDFYESDDYGIYQTEQRKGKGYKNDYDCSEWIREKWIKFPFAVLYNRNGTFEEHPAGQWFQLEITDKVTNRNVKNNCYDLTGMSERQDGYTYEFYALLRNHEMSGATIEYAVEAINNQPSPSGSENPYDRDGALTLDCSQDNSSITNANRAVDLTAKHSAYKQTFNDLISRIGNLTVQDSTDLRYSNLFKRKSNDDKWYIDGIVHAVDKSVQNAYLSWHKNNGDTATDIRGLKVSAYNQWYNTWHTAKWSDVGEDSNRCVATPLEAAKNNVKALRDKSEQLQLGYNLLWDIQVLSRDFADGNVQIEPKYYILDTKKDKLMAVDVWGSRDEDVTLVNEFGLMDKYGTDYFNQQKNKISDFAMLLNWDDEKARRNYSEEEKAATETASKVLGRTVLDANGMPMTTKNPLTGMEEEIIAPLSIPMGDGYREGNTQFLYLDNRCRTFIGNSRVTALHKDINGDDDQEISLPGADPDLGTAYDALGNPLGDNGVKKDEYSFCVSRWHVTLGLPSSAKFTEVTVDKNGNEKHLNPYEMITDEDTGDKIYAYQRFDPDYLKEHGDENRYMILETARITAYGAVFNLRYSQLMDNGTITAANGKTYHFADSATYKAENLPKDMFPIPTLLAVYSTSNSGRDYSTLQTH